LTTEFLAILVDFLKKRRKENTIEIPNPQLSKKFLKIKKREFEINK
jgi:hypothetical protein